MKINVSQGLHSAKKKKKKKINVKIFMGCDLEKDWTSFLFWFSLYTYSEMHILFSVIVLLFGVAWILHILYMQLLQKYFGYVYFGSQIMAVWYALTEVALWFKFYAFTTLSHQLVMPQCKFYFITCYRRLHFFVKVVPQWLSIMYVYLSGKRKKKKKKYCARLCDYCVVHY